MNFKAYINDKQIVFVNLALLLIGLYASLLVILRVDTTQTVAIIRNNTTLGLAGFEKADSSALYQLAIISIVITLIHTFLALRMRESKRSYALFGLGLGIVAQVFLIVVTSSILSLHR